MLLHARRQAGLEPAPLTLFPVFELDVAGFLLVAVVVLHVAVLRHGSPEEGPAGCAGLSVK